MDGDNDVIAGTANCFIVDSIVRVDVWQLFDDGVSYGNTNGLVGGTEFVFGLCKQEIRKIAGRNQDEYSGECSYFPKVGSRIVFHKLPYSAMVLLIFLSVLPAESFTTTCMVLGVVMVAVTKTYWLLLTSPSRTLKR